MTVLFAIIVAMSLGAALRIWAYAHGSVLDLQEKFQTRFYDSANEIVDRSDVSLEQLNELKSLSADLRNRKMQFTVLRALNRIDSKKPASSETAIRNNMTPEMNALWNKMYFRWLASVCAQGSFIGFGAVTKLLTYFDQDRPVTKELQQIPRAKILVAH
jgi:hypothetical protein